MKKSRFSIWRKHSPKKEPDIESDEYCDHVEEDSQPDNHSKSELYKFKLWKNKMISSTISHESINQCTFEQLITPLITPESREEVTSLSKKRCKELQLLHYCKSGSFSHVEMLLKSGISPHSMLDNGTHAIFVACEGGFVKCLQLLAEFGANLNEISPLNGLSVLHVACSRGYFDCVRFLLERKVDILTLATGSGRSCLHFAADNGNEMTLNILLSSMKLGHINTHSFINLGDRDGLTALHLACIEGQVPCVRMLIAAGAEPLIKDHSHRSAFDIAEIMERDEIIILLNTMSSKMGSSSSINSPSKQIHRSHFASDCIENSENISSSIQQALHLEGKWAAFDHRTNMFLVDSQGRVVLHISRFVFPNIY